MRTERNCHRSVGIGEHIAAWTWELCLQGRLGTTGAVQHCPGISYSPKANGSAPRLRPTACIHCCVLHSGQCQSMSTVITQHGEISDVHRKTPAITSMKGITTPLHHRATNTSAALTLHPELGSFAAPSVGTPGQKGIPAMGLIGHCCHSSIAAASEGWCQGWAQRGAAVL